MAEVLGPDLAGTFVEFDDDELASLIDAFWSYERALVANDVPTLESWFAPGAATLRTDNASTLVGADEIAAFRRARQPPPPRVVERLHLRGAGDGAVLVVAETARADGSSGAQTQLWVRHVHGWRIVAAHVAAAPAPGAARLPPGDVRVWRSHGVTEPIARPTARGPLDGVRVAVKDLVAVAGQRIGAGVPAWLDAAPVESRTAPALAALLASGASAVGLAHTDELAFSLAGATAGYGLVPNPVAPGRLAGGSSSGPAAAVAASQADLGLGTDTSGSIRVPASYTGLYGWRPTHGVVPTDGVLPLAPSFDTVGLLARDAELLSRAAAVLLPPAPSPAAIDALLIPLDLIGALPDATRVAFHAAARALAGRSGRRLAITSAAVSCSIAEVVTAYRLVQATEAWAVHGLFVDKHADVMDPGVVGRFRSGRGVSPEHLAQAQGLLARTRAELYELLPAGTALLVPSSSTPAPRSDLSAADMDAVRAATFALTCPASLAGLPAVSIPRMRVGALPVGLCLVGGRHSDTALLDLARS
ncbi:MAG: amidase [Frankiaceae bacterium]|nr:amidase [Frankiaceae bacterium]